MFILRHKRQCGQVVGQVSRECCIAAIAAGIDGTALLVRLPNGQSRCGDFIEGKLPPELSLLAGVGFQQAGQIL